MAPDGGDPILRLQDAHPYEPAGHEGVVNRLLIARQLQGSERVSVWHGALQDGGHAEPHVHAEADQVYVIIAGRVLVGIHDQEYELEALTAAFIPAGTNHWVHNSGPGAAELLVISSPALR